MSKVVLIVGCGQLGSRHLQAVASLSEVSAIHVVDPNAASLVVGQQRIKEIPDLNPNIKFSWHTSLDGAAPRGDLCIVATQSKGRPQLIKQIVERLAYRHFLVEKVVSQSLQGYEDLMAFCQQRDIAVWVNCKIRTYAIHQYIKSKLKADEPLFFSRVGGNFGLGNNGIHAVDLFAFYADAKTIKPVGSSIDPVLHPSKRGGDLFDLSGCLYGRSEKGDDLVLSLARGHESPDCLTIVSPSGRFFMDHIQKVAMESYPSSNWQWQPITIDENWMVSHMTKSFARDILNNKQCALPTLQQCWPAHQFILSVLQPHFEQLLGIKDHCPIT